MARTADLPIAEAKVQLRVRPDAQHLFGPWRDSVDLDPINLPIEVEDPSTGLPHSTDVFHPGLLDLVDTIVTLESEAPDTEYRLVWSAGGYVVKGTCPVCDDDFPVDGGVPGDELNEGYEAVCCGCDPADQVLTDIDPEVESL